MSKTIIVSNRLPVKILSEDDQLTYKPSEGGLATGLGSIYKDGDNLWIGWPGIEIKEKDTQEEVCEHLKEESMRPVFLTAEEIKDFYEGFSNETLWPCFHYFNEYVVYEQSLFEAYERVNRKFAEAIVEHAQPGDTLWIHDYQLLLVPGMVREMLPKISIGFFLHIPFPSYEVFRLLPWRKQLLSGMLGADLLGFHTYDDMRHFLSSVGRLVGYSNLHGKIQLEDRKIIVDSFPMGIDYEKYANSAASPETIRREVRYRTHLGEQKLILSIDRLDYSKGINKRLRAFELFLERYPEYHEKVSLVMVVVPSRDQVPKYKRLKEEIDELTGRINGTFGRIAWTPIHYFYRSFPLEALSAFYRMADVALVTPLRDGMNLVCKEFIASKLDRRGVLILSEMAGASKELSDAILINPNDINKLVESLKRGLEMPEDEQIRHMSIMQASLRRYNIHHWVNLFMDRLEDIKREQEAKATLLLDEDSKKQMFSEYEEASERLIFLDYDGTLSPFVDDPKDAYPDSELKEILETLGSMQENRVVVISGRDRTTLENWLGDMPIDLICEHGVWLRRQNEDWTTIEFMTNDWKSEILKVLELYVDRTPGSFIEEKDYSLVWHYRKVETGLGELRTRELTSHLKYLTTNIGLQVLEGDMVLEIKSLEVNKGRGAKKWLTDFPAEFIFAVGDDETDEDMFRIMPKSAYTIKVGRKNSEARFNLKNHRKVRELLRTMAGMPEQAATAKTSDTYN
ncbi:MAG: bifunctional alpha,alpha-trehalose-phosphate synthase (UDP-forming)/trehalose-phosphatase [Cyclobacteriaceae bacterium]